MLLFVQLAREPLHHVGHLHLLQLLRQPRRRRERPGLVAIDKPSDQLVSCLPNAMSALCLKLWLMELGLYHTIGVDTITSDKVSSISLCVKIILIG